MHYGRHRQPSARHEHGLQIKRIQCTRSSLRCDFRAVDDVLGRQAREVRAMTRRCICARQTATRLPSPAKVHAAMVDPVPPPRITRSKSSGCVFLSAWADEVLSVRFMRLFLSERQVHSEPPGRTLRPYADTRTAIDNGSSLTEMAPPQKPVDRRDVPQVLIRKNR